MIETIVYYSLQRVGSFGVVPSPINRRWEKEAAEREARQTVKVTMGDLQIVVFVCGEDVTDPEIYEQITFLKRAAIGLVPGFAQSEYVETPAGEGFVNDVPEADWVDSSEADDEFGL
jgi:hypothetical protein